MKTITRKSLLYKTGVGGMDYCLNHVQGCSHGCRYPCYAFNMKRSYGTVRGYDEWCEPQIVVNALELLDRELPRLRQKIHSVHLCFSTDPFMYNHPEVGELSLKIIEKVNVAGIPVSVLTKGILPHVLGDKKRFREDNDYGISLVSLDENFRRRWEPGAAPYRERVAALKYLHDQGFPTWVHMEPYPTPNIVQQDLVDILKEISFTDHIMLLGWNYNPIVRQYKDYKSFYAEQARILDAFCAKHKIKCSS